MQPFGMLKDRQEAGLRLAEKLVAYRGRVDAVVLGLPRGGVVVAFEVAKALDLPLDVYLVRKLGTPGQEELALGAIASGGVMVLNEDLVRALRLDRDRIEEIAARERRVLEQREKAYRGHAAPASLEGKTVILVDDGLATGASMRTVIKSLRAHGPSRIVVAVPTAPFETCAALEKEVDEVVCSMTPTPFSSIGEWYEDFSQTSDEEVVDLLEKSREFGRSATAVPKAEGSER